VINIVFPRNRYLLTCALLSVAILVSVFDRTSIPFETLRANCFAGYLKIAAGNIGQCNFRENMKQKQKGEKHKRKVK
jgi:hypothetical protein